MIEKKIIEESKAKMTSTLENLKHSLSGLRTGRASASLLEPIKVEVYGGALMPINQLATISVPEARMLSVQVWDSANTKSVEKAIQNASLGLNTILEGNTIKVPIPDLSEERRKELTKKAHEYGENAKIATRNIRRHGIDEFKKLEKDKAISEDDMRKYSDEIQKLTDEYVKKIDETVSMKNSEILKV